MTVSYGKNKCADETVNLSQARAARERGGGPATRAKKEAGRAKHPAFFVRKSARTQ
jgi:hypothetical protein